jgi:hypothetical protein
LAFSLSAPNSLSAVDDGCSPGELSDAQVQEAIDELDVAGENRDVARRAIREGGDNAIQVIADLDDPTVLYDFVEEAGGDGTDLIRRFDSQQRLKQFFTFEKPSGSTESRVDDTVARDARIVLARSVQAPENDYDIGRVEQFAEDTDELKQTEGINSLVDDIANKRGNFRSGFDRNSFNDVQGSIFEARVGGDLGAENVRRLNLEYDPEDAGNGSDIDVLQRSDGSVTIVDAKAGEVDTSSGGIGDQFDKYQKLNGQSIGTDDEIAISENANIEFVITNKRNFVGDTPAPVVNTVLIPFIRDVQRTPGARIWTVDGRELGVTTDADGETVIQLE